MARDRTVLVAGAAGLAGRSVVESLLVTCPDVVVRGAVRHLVSPIATDARVEYVEGDLRDPDDCRRMSEGCDAAIMCAASTGGAGQLVSEPWRQVNDNLVMNARLLEACAFAGVRRLVWVGSASLYQDFDGRIREEDLDLNLDPPHAYFGVGWVARLVEKLGRFWHERKGLEIVMTRTSNIYGPFARFEPGSSNFIPALIRKAVDRVDPFEVWGSPDVTRDVVYSKDFGRAVVGLLLAEGVAFDVFNLGSGATTRVDEVVKSALDSAGHAPSRIEYRNDRPSTIRLRALDCGKLQNAIGWKPRYGVEEGIRETVEWWRENKSTWAR